MLFTRLRHVRLVTVSGFNEVCLTQSKRITKFLARNHLVRLVGCLILMVILFSSHSAMAIMITDDFGDAPDATNNIGSSMQAYSGVTANFPTAVVPNQPPYGPHHKISNGFFILGQTVSTEENADYGMDNDPDGINNINPALDDANVDGGDDGLVLPITLTSCQPVTLTYNVTLLANYSGPIYANFWSDWNRDGDWKDGNAQTCSGGNEAPEWVLQNEQLSLTTTGTYSFDITFTPNFPETADAIWLRLSLSDQPANADGSAPENGYSYGETEDYFLQLGRYPGSLAFMPFIASNNPGPPLPPSPIISETVAEPEVQISLPQISTGVPVVVNRNQIQVKVKNTGSGDRMFAFNGYIYANGTEYRLTSQPQRINQGATTTVEIALDAQINLPSLRSPGTLVLNSDVWPVGAPMGNARTSTTNDIYQFHGVESTTENGGNNQSLVLYDQEALKSQLRTLNFYQNPRLSSDMADLLSVIGDISTLTSASIYDASDPLLSEAPVMPDSIRQLPLENGIGTSDSHQATYEVCPEWLVNAVDTDAGEVFGAGANNNTGWRARGAHVTIYVSPDLTSWQTIYNNTLDGQGCHSFTHSSPVLHILIRFNGPASLQSGSNTISMVHYDTVNSQNAATALTAILSATPNAGNPYRPEVTGWDGFGILTFVIDQRFNGGAGPLFFRLYSDTCPFPNTGGNCAPPSPYNGAMAIFLNNNGWRRKFLAAHEWGHRVLRIVAPDYDTNCGYAGIFGNGSGHSMNSAEHSNCAAMEGWAHFVAADAWNDHSAGPDPDAVFVHWDAASTVYNVDYAPNQNWCPFINVFGLNNLGTALLFCEFYNPEVRWMRHWWDFHTNNSTNEPGYPPSHFYLMNLVDQTDFSGLPIRLSQNFADALSGNIPMWNRWNKNACWNGIQYFNCP